MDIIKEAQKVLAMEAVEITAAKKRLGRDFIKAIEILKECKGKVVVSGIGKSGLVGQKIAATMSSMGTPAVFLHPVEAAHGDMGIFMKGDVVIMLSQSGETEEVINILPALGRLNIPIIAITGKKNSSLAKSAVCVLSSSVKEEACPLNLAPTCSTTVQLALGDALSVVLLKMKNFKKEDFAMLHPGGSLGKKLVLKVKDIMHTGESVPKINKGAVLKDGLLAMTEGRFGCVAVTGENGKLAGIFTDGDLRRLLEKQANPFMLKMSEVMVKNPKIISEGELVIKALGIMEEKSITVLLVLSKDGRPNGIIHLHDILKSGVV
ncbi:MAG TPA: KpsF/GutQ family sugar-phosphate isomerase [Candidatus Goldiibacteriota bacterium]|nr:KpsF/GutQ family sugar-phosphate isomerase [Candidatus Goldiibacteriota bacterium]HRQ42901.1 KpsF/GutQ family sugar-phosphate isomerase [Candidatus Goldiibacteriota bacterium]